MTPSPTLHDRLNTLPRKTAQPFRELLQTGYLTDDVLSQILDAGELAGHTSKLLGFAVGYLHLRSQGIPIHDVIRMAKSQHRRINLSWSPKRWKEEHDRLARAETLYRLTATNVTYTLTRYKAHLPAHFPGYLIGSSRRLAMEGFRQRHCVANYHDQVISGACAIATVFLHHTRWTVQLGFPQDPAHPLCIRHVRGRNNVTPTQDITRQIHELLEIPLPNIPAASAPTRAEDTAYLTTLRELLPLLRHHRIHTVTVSFDGCGDSGSIDAIRYDPEDHPPFTNLTLQYDKPIHRFEDGQWMTTTEPVTETVEQAIEELTYTYLETTGINWYDNDGGYGDLIIDVQEGTVSLEINTRYNESRTEFSAYRNILTGEEVGDD